MDLKNLHYLLLVEIKEDSKWLYEDLKAAHPDYNIIFSNLGR